MNRSPSTEHAFQQATCHSPFVTVQCYPLVLFADVYA